MKKLLLGLAAVLVCLIVIGNFYKAPISQNLPGHDRGCYSSGSIAFLDQPGVYDGKEWHFYVPANAYQVVFEIMNAADCFLKDTTRSYSSDYVQHMQKVTYGSPKVLTPEQIATVSKLYGLMMGGKPCLSPEDQQILADAAEVADQEYHNHDMSSKFQSYDFRLGIKDTSFGNRPLEYFADILRNTGIPACTS